MLARSVAPCAGPRMAPRLFRRSNARRVFSRSDRAGGSCYSAPNICSSLLSVPVRRAIGRRARTSTSGWCSIARPGWSATRGARAGKGRAITYAGEVVHGDEATKAAPSCSTSTRTATGATRSCTSRYWAGSSTRPRRRGATCRKSPSIRRPAG